MKEYIEFSNKFRKSNGSKESVEKMYDLLYELENIEKSKQENLVLSNVYILLCFHRSAYETFKETADPKNSKDVSKLYVLEQKAKSHENNFIIKDVRKLREKKEQPIIKLSDFELSKKQENKFEIKNRKLVIFNKLIKDGKLSIYLPNEDIDSFFDKIIIYIAWLGDCKKELINFYNNECDVNVEQKADSDWYDTLEIYRAEIFIDEHGNISTSIVGGDDFFRDHLLDIEINDRIITSITYNG
ncbi:hypothetical protein [Flavobacterium sharifuzzamanii]|uniref:hypothetical protein n=1 Tax=Flavobacterium sharifuzzamanii TaxID=2211133 RepID=UPI001300271C|nr:hypothetical protein [Flavobacterium sharifuzzamanii]KAF2081960.1 hypothetical protein DMA14_05690 [Flavobacterium sharifuzzamanii]